MAHRDVQKAIILVGGKGTRLRPLTYSVPKPLVPFCNKPMLWYQMEKLAKAGIKEVILAVNYYSEKIMIECEKFEEEFGMKIVYSKENFPLGTGGPLALASEYLVGGPFFMLNSDICSDADLKEMKDKFTKSDSIGMIMTYDINTDPSEYGLIKISGDRIVQFEEKKPRQALNDESPSTINAGVYIFTEEIFKYIDLREISIEREVFPLLAVENQLVQYKHRGYWTDIGKVKDYLLGQRMHLENTPIVESSAEIKAGLYKEGMIFPKYNVVIGKNVSLGEGVVLENCTILGGSTIKNNAVVRNSIVGWNSMIASNCRVEEYTILGNGSVVDENQSPWDNEEKTGNMLVL